ncbi:DGQHR domain-containing protein [Clostridium botulinum]|nr:DGQHR domain-containing protein [Clostridium botulinum]
MAYTDLSGLAKKSNQIVLNGVRGMQFGKEVISVQCTVNDILKFLEIDGNVQREVDTNKVASIKKYIQYGLDGNNIYFSPLIFSARGNGNFNETKGKFILNMNESLIILDGQHRIKAFEELKNRLQMIKNKDEEDKTLNEKYTSILEFPLSIQIYRNLNLQQERQLFTDINTKSSVVSNTLLIMYKEGDLYGSLVKEIIKSHPSICSDSFECRAKTTRTKFMTAATLYIISKKLNEGAYNIRSQYSKINLNNYSKFKSNTEHFLTLLIKYAPKDALDRDKYIIFIPNVITAIAMFVYKMQKQNEDLSMEELFKEVIYNIDWSHKNSDFTELAVKFNKKTKKYNFGAIGRIVRTFSNYLIKCLQERSQFKWEI